MHLETIKPLIVKKYEKLMKNLGIKNKSLNKINNLFGVQIKFE